MFDLGQRKQKEYGFYRLVTQPVGAAVLALLLSTLRRGSLDGWRDDAAAVMSSVMWTLPLMLVAVFGPAYFAARKQQRKST